MTKARILIIDDERGSREVFSEILRRNGFETETASSGTKALEIIERAAFDLILLDLRMPEMDGVETLRRIRAVHPNVPIYIITGFKGKYSERLLALQTEGIAFEILTKPIPVHQLLFFVNCVIEKKDDAVVQYTIRLYTAGKHPELMTHFEKLQDHLKAKAKTQFSFEIIDCLKHPELAEEAYVFATPTLVKATPLPERRIIGNITNIENVSAALGIL